jgi:hypothetical protein
MQTRLIKQFMSNHVVDLNGDRATGFSYIEARYVPAVGPTQGRSMIAAGRYDEGYLRTAIGWRIYLSRLKLFYFVPLDVGYADGRLDYVS